MAATAEPSDKPSSPFKAGDLVFVLARFVAIAAPEEGRDHAGAIVRIDSTVGQSWGQRIVRLEDLHIVPAEVIQAA